MRIAFITPGAYMAQKDNAEGNLLGTEHQIFGLAKEFIKKNCEVYSLLRWLTAESNVIDGVNVMSFKSSRSPQYDSLDYQKINICAKRC